jgi:hypothetical protein
MERLSSGARAPRRLPASVNAVPVHSPLLPRPAPRQPLDAASVLRLQRSAGNAAVAALLAQTQPVAGGPSGSRSSGTGPGPKGHGARARAVIQRDVGVEFQARNVISKNKGATKFDRMQTKRKPLKQIGGLSMEVDTGSVMEFGTGHYSVWSALKKDLDAVTSIVTEIQALPKEALNPAKPVGADNPLVFRGFKTDHGKVDVTAQPADFHGKPQTNEEIGLSDFGSLVKENRRDMATTVSTAATGLAAKVPTPNLTGFLQVIILHLKMAQDTAPRLVISNGKVTQPKAFFSLLNKTDYTAMFQSLTATEQKEFTRLVNSNLIATAAGVSMTDDLFRVGYWGWHPDRSNMRILIKEGKIAKIQKKIRGVEGEGKDKDIHTCGAAGVPDRYCRTKRPIERVTVGAWLKSMIKPSKRTKKSVSAPLPTYSGSKGGGFSWGLTKPFGAGSFLFEVRNQGGIPIADWPDVAEDRFNIAANCRPGSKLTYDGKKPKPKCP